jgi:hypothetical protein
MVTADAGDTRAVSIINVIPPPARESTRVKPPNPADAAARAMIAANCAPTPFETSLFRGKVLVLLRTKPLAGFGRARFEGRQRMFEIQIQGAREAPRGAARVRARFEGAERRARPASGRADARARARRAGVRARRGRLGRCRRAASS